MIVLFVRGHMEFDAAMILRCFDLALRGLGTVTPNPLVGSIVVRDEKILGEGYHQRSGEAHAEVFAITQALENVDNLEGCTLYCSLEPCCHTNKRTPPCTELIIKNKIKKVVISNLDPNPMVAGKGVERLRSVGIEVVTGIEEIKGAEINRVFFHHINSSLPYLHLKIAQTLDGRIASATGDAKWISNEEARTRVHQWRLEYDAVMVGRGTLNADNPGLDVRHVENKNKIPYRIVVGNPSEMNWDFKILSDAYTERTIIVARPDQMKQCSLDLMKLIIQRKITVVEASNLRRAMEILSAKKITSILVEGGAGLASSLIEENLVNRLSIFIAPKLMGNGPIYYNQEKNFLMNHSLTFKKVSWTPFAGQMLFEGEL